jgi:tetratricopeptide (TPR) repeat protein
MDRGVLLHMQKKYDAAIADFTKYIARDYKGLEGYLQRGRALFAKRDLMRAADEFSALIKMSPTHTAAIINRGLVRMELKQYDLAAADFTKLIEIDSTNSSYYEYRALAYRKAGKIDLALDDGVAAQASTPREIEEATTANLDELVDLKPDEVEERLFKIAVLAVRLHKDAQIHLIGYGGQVGPAGDAVTLLGTARSQLERFAVPSSRIVTTDGGFREKRTVEVYLVPPGGETPDPTPTVDPSEVKRPRPAPKKVGAKRR